ncbi:MAG: co-chaperone GroES [Gammaproteobacteria bacterium]|nr:co-chaperone GroES [Gammaproteobacteria bacterium]
MFKPIGDRVLAKLKEVEDTRSSGIILATANKEKPQIATIIEVSESVKLKKGDEIALGKFAGSPIKIEEENYIVIEYKDILGVFK